MLKKITINKNRLILAVSVGIILSFILGFGGYAQKIFINALFSESSTLYETLIPEGCCLSTKSLSFFDWIKSLYSTPLLILSILTCYVALQYQNTRRLVIFISIGTFLTLTVNDIYLYFMHPELQPSLTESLLSNALGSPVIAICIGIILLLINRASDFFSVPFQISNIIFPVLIGIFIVLILFVLIKNLFGNTQSTISGFISPPLYGDYSSTPVKDQEKKFGLFTNQENGIDKLTWSGNFLNMKLETEHPTKKADVSLFLMEGCINKNTKDILKSLSKPNFSNNDASKIVISIDDGMGAFSIYSRDNDSGYWGLADDNLAHFSVDTSKDKNKLDLTRVSIEGSNLFHNNWFGEVIYRIDAMMLDNKQTIPRKISINTDGVVTNYNFSINDTLAVDKADTCKPILTSKHSSNSKSPYLTALLRITYPKIKTLRDINETPHTNVHGLSGWFEVKDISYDEFSNYVSNGELNMLSVVGDFDELYIDKEKQDKKKSSWLYMKDGVITGKSNRGSFNFEGKSDTALLDGKRITKTRWERISTSIWWLILLIPSVLTVLLNSFRKCWINDEKLVNFH